MRKTLLLSALTFAVSSTFAINAQLVDTVKKHPIYIGLDGGYGSTNWNGLVDAKYAKDGSDVSVPTSAKDGGFVWGIFGGYEFYPYFALEANFKRYSNAYLKFDDSNIYFDFTPTHMTTRTINFNIIAKVMLPIGNTGIRFYSDLGPAYTYRWDSLANTGHMAATFGAGFNYNFQSHWMAQLGFDYTTGSGKSDNTPVKEYFPFLYSLTAGIAYRFGV